MTVKDHRTIWKEKNDLELGTARRKRKNLENQELSIFNNRKMSNVVTCH
ncbi:hypothetical protein [Listeria seeligeri]|nr:hypothetical protein [Listeria seeligeri]